MNIKQLLFVICYLIVTIAGGQDRASWMKDAKWGVMNHYLADWIARTEKVHMDVDKWNQLIDNFDVKGLAQQLRTLGVGYYILTIGQNSGYYLAPNKVYDDIVKTRPTKCSKRDLVADLADELGRNGIKLIVYLPSGAPNSDDVAKNALAWKNGAFPNKEFQTHWEAVIAEWSNRWEKKIHGWWFDGCYWPNTMYRDESVPNFKSFASAARAGNPESVVAFNPGVVNRTLSITPYEDYIAGEISNPELISIRRVADGKIDGAQLHILSYLGEQWGMGAPRFTNDKVIEWSNMIIKEGGAVTWDVPLQSNGLMSHAFMDQLSAIRDSLR